MQNTHKM